MSSGGRSYSAGVDLRLVEYFVAVIDHGSVTRAAQALYIAQPSLSQAIRSLERQLGVQLFHRTGRQLVLTPDGEAFAAPARRILRDVERARKAAHDVRALESGQLDIAALATLAAHPLPELAGEFHRRHPGVLLNVSDPGVSARVVDEVRRGNAELGLTKLPPQHSSSLLTRELGTQEIVLVLPPALAEQLPDPVPLAAVAGIPLVLELTDTRTLVDDVLDTSALTVAVESANRQAIWDLVAHGAGATFLPRALAERELHGAVLRSITPELRRSVGFVHRPGPLSPAAEAFLTVAGVSPAPSAGTPAPPEKAPPGRRAPRKRG
ncbi:DNA-binding transcriptional regulator, LysR family [Saccharopolyspora antimicrobica]|uniref:DNA-binding transcriptional LysR family regulator n=1 Tax=Saccharopolyspora antimicrobica TaxID=455193 RepID=A0A1I4SAK6_9PSEU|nr:DNA-binding transcriptional LysR family regulator [Saccharopolyspora antimicrobica]SFM61502.1 DNA-binding transcriptional regulator, LysR family [Saccharopolyspora antimicrobica]